MTHESMVEHHTHYKEIHGFDKTVMMTHSEHEKLHNRLRKNGKCNVTVEELTKISMAAHGRTDKVKNYQKKYKKMFRLSEHGKEYIKNYRKNYQSISFVDAPGPNIQFCERIKYNHKTGTITYTAGFYGHHGYTIPMIDIDERRLN